MNRKPQRPLLVVIVGATGTGKTKLSMEIAKRWPCEILNFDSQQVYKRLDIGTAKPTREEQKAAPHHLIDVMEYPQTMSAGDFRKRSLEVLKDCWRRQVPLVVAVGGTGFYLQALIKGMHAVPEVSPEMHQQVREELKIRGNQELYEELRKLDPETAAKISIADSYRICRALELQRTLGPGVKLSSVRSTFAGEVFPYRVVVLGLKRRKPILLQAIRERTHFMVEKGILEELTWHQAKGMLDWAPFNSVGYREGKLYLLNKISRVDLEDLIVQSTMQLAKRQSTWFKRDSSIAWFDTDFGLQYPLSLVQELAVSAGLH